MNRINPDKLYHSKWTATTPKNKEKHFLVTELVRDDDEHVIDVILQAVLTHREQTLPWRALKDDTTWLMGWR
ncbi:TIGR02450 family Trp-rich protein [Larsenimonas salina]|uniref:TIGR02450 family Trp-rich protein n=1 Tax=Larsenimonas salina TaxID=1295565 RepID=UPI0020742357|nr:TIGR02450 family Trp-rich protein [Larsenimonas salina]MCM5704020.1 TIGR02450 family Trp-rich protein [Larsenimonas salina]